MLLHNQSNNSGDWERAQLTFSRTWWPHQLTATRQKHGKAKLVLEVFIFIINIFTATEVSLQSFSFTSYPQLYINSVHQYCYVSLLRAPVNSTYINKDWMAPTTEVKLNSCIYISDTMTTLPNANWKELKWLEWHQTPRNQRHKSCNKYTFQSIS